MESNSGKHSVVSITGNTIFKFIFVSLLNYVFIHSSAEPKGSDCFESFKAMQDCMSNYPTLYGNDDKPGEDEEENEVPKEESKESSKEESSSEDQTKT